MGCRDIDYSSLPTRIALVDGNNFYVSCERVFDPKLEGKPVVVLSNQDGCIVARSQEVRDLSVKMGTPWHTLHGFARQHQIIALSSNYALYGDLSARMMSVIGQFSPDQEIYSIDESFLDWSGFQHLDLVAYGHQLRERVRHWVGTPVGVGIGPNKTLAKACNHIAKKFPQYNGVFDLARLSPAEATELFSGISVSEVWGVGRQLTARLAERKIFTVADLRAADPSEIHRTFSVVLARTVKELRGESCIAMEEAPPPKQQLMCSRGFGHVLKTETELAEAVSTYAARTAEKLRTQHSLAGIVQVFIQTNPFRERDKQYSRGVTVPLNNPSDDTLILTRAALAGLHQIYKPGFNYHKAGVMLSELTPAAQRQDGLFEDPAQLQRNEMLMATMDHINAKMGRGTVRLACTGMHPTWGMRQERRTPRYTTRWDEIPTAYC
ncbi:Y-family DNA polymerase [Chitinimonas sp. BJB300]|uniref:Y-family DNA polymerase n=1 Tax=Chitinimonas sp. BJB300 TaxID=1559339 RepID=UPI000C0CDFEA|nr:Y-family DNA polymerase [Chitinimonas sp. BJB300]PHV10527.1 DNA polymerase V subunit UmuC [Chitinimonas sp. BJB300]TSJ85221.1 Y-family DNA polymerase [Chitinimonas sp. BJB300]